MRDEVAANRRASSSDSGTFLAILKRRAQPGRQALHIVHDHRLLIDNRRRIVAPPRKRREEQATEAGYPDHERNRLGNHAASVAAAVVGMVRGVADPRYRLGSPCSRCGKPRDRQMSYCLACLAAYMRERRRLNPDVAEQGRAQNRAYKADWVVRARASERERLRKAGIDPATVPHINRLVVLELADGVCGICGEDVDPLDYELDHTMPLSLGGEHSFDNVTVAHRDCNQHKHNTAPDAVHGGG